MGFFDYLRMAMGWWNAETTTPALAAGYRIAASQAIVPGSVASQSRVPTRTQQAVNAGSEASESR